MFISNAAIPRNRLKELCPSIFATEQKGGLSEKYQFVPTIEVVEQMEKAGWSPVKVNETRCRDVENRDYTKHQIRFRMMNSGVSNNLQVGDTFVETVVTNSHNGKSSFIFDVGLFRLACSNGMIVSESSFDSLRVRHSGYDASQIFAVTNKIIEKAPDVIETVNDFKQIELSETEQFFFADAAKTLRFDKPKLVSNYDVLKSHRLADSGNDMWKILNRVQENLVKGGIKYRDPDSPKVKNKTSRGIKSIDADTKLNKAIWALADAMKRIKKEGYNV